jgi:predicted DNA-binding ribbon-helix-helix protein
MKSLVVKRSVFVGGHKISISLEDAFWDQLREIARTQRLTSSKLIAAIDENRQQSNLSSAIRLFVLELRPREGERQSGIRSHRRQISPTY